MLASVTAVAANCRSDLALRTCSAFAAPSKFRFGFSWRQSVASTSDSAPPTSSLLRHRHGPGSQGGLRAITGSPVHLGIYADSNTSQEGFEPEPTSSPESKARLSNKCIAYVRSSLGLKSKIHHASKDTIFLAIDTEGTKDNLTELGISTFDTRDIKNLDPGPSALEWSKHIKSRQFRFKVGQRKPFLFGAVEHRIPLTAIRPYLRLRSDRLYILVGHALHNDIKKLAHVLEGHELCNEPNVVATVDTYALVQQCRLTLPGRLSELWRFLVNSSPGVVTPGDVVKLFSPKHHTADWDFKSRQAFHNAGNDAFYTMHTLLMLALQPELLRKPRFGSSLAGVFLTAGSAAWQLVRRLAKGSSKIKSIIPGSYVRRPDGVAAVQPHQSSKSKELTIRLKHIKP